MLIQMGAIDFQNFTSQVQILNELIYVSLSYMKPESVSKMLINQMLLCYGSIFACQVLSWLQGFIRFFFLLENAASVEWFFIIIC